MKVSSCTACIGHKATIKALQGVVQRISIDLEDSQALVKRLSRDLNTQDATIKQMRKDMDELSAWRKSIEDLDADG